MATSVYKGEIRLHNIPNTVKVQVETTSPQTAKKIIEAQYAGSFKSWAKQMTSK